MADHAATPDPPDDVPGSPESGTAELARLFRAHNANLLQLLRARLRSDHAAWDVPQDAYLRMPHLDRLGTVRNACRPAPFHRATCYLVESTVRSLHLRWVNSGR